MPPRYSTQQADQPGRGEHRPTLPPIRDLFREELSVSVPASPQNLRHRSASPHVTLNLSPGDESQYAPEGSRPAHHYPDDRSIPPPSHSGITVELSYGANPGGTPPGHGALYRHPPTVPSSSHPFAPPQSQPDRYASIPIPGSSAVGQPQDTPSQSGTNTPLQSHRYECSWCGKGFTRPSSLKIHLNTHTGEKPFVCPYEGCNRSFSVQSNMRRHARVHTRSTESQPEEGSEDENEPLSDDGS